jgi:hypothetical protein
LNGVVAVLAGLGFHLEDAVGSGEDDRDGDHHTMSVIDAGVAEFFT